MVNCVFCASDVWQPTMPKASVRNVAGRIWVIWCMNLELVGKRAVVTGSTAGIGLATARMLAAEGARVVINGRTAARVEEAVGAIVDVVHGAEVRGIAADLGTAAGCES